MNKKILSILFLFLFITSIVIVNNIEPVKAQSLLISNTVGSLFALHSSVVHPSSTAYPSANGQSIRFTSNTWISGFEIYGLNPYNADNNLIYKCIIYNTTGSYGSTMIPNNVILYNSTNILNATTPTYNVPTYWYFEFNDVFLPVGDYFFSLVCVGGSAQIQHGYSLYMTTTSGFAGNAGSYANSQWSPAGAGGDFWFLLYGSNTAPPTPTPAIPSGTVKVNFAVNNSNLPNNVGNITWCALVGGFDVGTQVLGNNGLGAIYLNDKTDILVKTQILIDSGYYFKNFTSNLGLIRTYTVNQFAVTLDASLGFEWNIAMYIDKISNNVNVTFNNGLYGDIYFQYVDNSVLSNVKYGAGTYDMQKGTLLQVGCICDIGYKLSYYDVYYYDTLYKVADFPLVITTDSNMIVTPYYVIDSVTGVTDGWGSLFGFLGGFTWQNIAVLIIYIVICALSTYFFAFTGLIAGLDISTVICFITGLLGDLMYPVLGLVIVVNIALIALGSGLLNRRKNGTDA